MTPTSSTSASPISSSSVPSTRTDRRALLGGLAYTGAWVAGLAVATAGTDVTSSGAQVVAALSGHTGRAATQYVLAEVVAAAGRRDALPRWLSPVAVLLGVTVAASGVGYLLLVPAFATAAFVSLPLLLLWVTGAGLAVARRSRTAG